jgi:hypothetical protein
MTADMNYIIELRNPEKYRQNPKLLELLYQIHKHKYPYKPHTIYKVSHETGGFYLI